MVARLVDYIRSFVVLYLMNLEPLSVWLYPISFKSTLLIRSQLLVGVITYTQFIFSSTSSPSLLQNRLFLLIIPLLGMLTLFNPPTRGKVRTLYIHSISISYLDWCKPIKSQHVVYIYIISGSFSQRKIVGTGLQWFGYFDHDSYTMLFLCISYF